MHEGRVLGLIASPNTRKENGIAEKFVKQHVDVLANYHLVVTQGTFEGLFMDRREYDPQKPTWACRYGQLTGTVLRPGKDGGIVQLSNYLLSDTSGCDVVIFFTDPVDVETNFPENRALFRNAELRNRTLLATEYAATLWARNEAEGARKDMPAHEENDAVALIAHDAKKLDMCHFVVRHRKELARFRRIMATGTTGEWTQKFLRLFGDLGMKVDTSYSGPHGGDIRIANAIINKECQHVCFFIDPLTSHPHEADIYALIRACTFEGVRVNLRTTYDAARSWITHVK